MTKSLFTILADSKQNTRQEFQIFLFKKCNLSCSFCFFSKEDLKSNDNGLNTIIFQAFDLVKQIKQIEEATKTSKQYTINIMGGEVFSDFIDNKYFEDYFQYCKIIKTQLEIPYNLDIEYNFITNLVYSNLDRVKNLYYRLKAIDVNVSIGTSYDFSGRFNSKTKSIFNENINNLPQSICNSISIVLTKQNIRKLLTNSDNLFKEYYNKGYNIYFDHFSPSESNPNSVKLCPSEVEIYQAFSFLRDIYPNTYPVKDLLKNSANSMSCRRSLVVKDNSPCGNCRNLDCTSRDFNLDSANSGLDNVDIETSFLQKYNCMTCPYFKRCPLSCFLLNSYRYFESSKECQMRRFFEESEGLGCLQN